MKKYKILLQPNSSALIYVNVSFKIGSIYDPSKKNGLASLTLSMLLRGTKKHSYKKFHEKLDTLGAEIGLGKNMESLSIYAVTLSNHLDIFLSLLKEMLSQPAFIPEELKKIKRQYKSAMQDELGDDREIAERRFQEYFLQNHPYGKITSGNPESLDNITIKDVRSFYKTYFSSQVAVFSATGNFKRREMEQKARSLLQALPSKPVQTIHAPPTSIDNGGCALILEKPNCTQSQVYIGAKGLGRTNPDYLAATIANQIFGGSSLGAQLMKEIREKRGWSYGAYGYFRSAKNPLYYNMHTTPSNENTIGAIELMLKLYEKFAKKGITKSEFQFAKKSLYNNSAFLQDTLRKRLNNKVSEEILELPKGFYDSYRKKLSAVTYIKVQSAIKRHWDPKNLFILVLGSSTLWRGKLKKIKRIKKITALPYSEYPK